MVTLPKNSIQAWISEQSNKVTTLYKYIEILLLLYRDTTTHSNRGIRQSLLLSLLWLKPLLVLSFTVYFFVTLPVTLLPITSTIKLK